MPGKGKETEGPIRGPNPCHGCTERFIACSDNCPKDKRGEYGREAWKAEVKRVKKNQREYMRRIGVRMKNWNVIDEQ